MKGLFELPVSRPTATSMLFLGIALTGLVAYFTIPIELVPSVEGNRLEVVFSRPASEPEIVEREMLIPLERRVEELPDVKETRAEITGSGGQLTVQFEPGTDVKVRELEMRRLAASILQTQPQGSLIDVQSFDSRVISKLAMQIEIIGGADEDSLYALADERILPRFEGVPGVAQVFLAGGAPEEVTVRLDAERAAALGVPVDAVAGSLARAVGRLRYVGGVEGSESRRAVLVDGRPEGIESLSRLQVLPDRGVQLRHVAEIERGSGRREVLYRVDGKPSVAAVVFKEDQANLIALGRALRARIDELSQEFATYGIDFRVATDASELVDDQLRRLKSLAVTGFAIALLVLFLFLRQVRAVLVVAIAVPCSLLLALSLLVFTGNSLNLVTLLGLTVGIGMLVDNSIVVYEAVQRRLERGSRPGEAAVGGVVVTVRAIVAATATNAIVFLPVLFVDLDDASQRALVAILALSIVLPLFGSLLVAIGLVPLLARHLAAPAAARRIAAEARRRASFDGLLPPERGKELFAGLVTVALKRPGAWLTGVIVAVFLTILIAVPAILVSGLGDESLEADMIRIEVEVDGGTTLARAAGIFDRFEAPLRDLDEIEAVTSIIREDGGALMIQLVDRDERKDGLSASGIRRLVRQQAYTEQGIPKIPGVGIQEFGSLGDGGDDSNPLAALDAGPAKFTLSGSDSVELSLVARALETRLREIDEVSQAWTAGCGAMSDEVWVSPNASSLAGFGLTADQILPALGAIPREGVVLRTGFTLKDGREIPLTVRREGEREDLRALSELRVATVQGVFPMSALTDIRRMPPPIAICHKNGRREISVQYWVDSDVPKVGAARANLERRIREIATDTPRPPGYTVEQERKDRATNWFRKIGAPVVLLLYGVLAITFESLLLPLLVLVALPLTLIGAAWALVLSGTPFGIMSAVGALLLLGLTVNPAILLVDRMQEKARIGHWSAGAAALAAVRERTRPVLMTTATTVAGLWPLALATGHEFELWPPFATVVIGGLIASSVLTLLVIPVGFVWLRRLDELLGWLGPWFVIAWLGATSAVIVPLVWFGVIESVLWQLVTLILVAGLLLAISVFVFRRPQVVEPKSEGDEPPRLDIRFLHKTYGLPGPIGRAWRITEVFARRVAERGGEPHDPVESRRRFAPLFLVTLVGAYFGFTLQTSFWRVMWTFGAAVAAVVLVKELRRARGRVDELGRATRGGVEGLLAVLIPWLAWGSLAYRGNLLPRIGEREPWIALWVLVGLAIVVALIQFGRSTAMKLSTGRIREKPEKGLLRAPRGIWRRVARRVFGLDLPTEEITALSNVEFAAEKGMIGVLGPNGAGKTTLLRMLAGVLDPSRGRITLGGAPLDPLRRRIARWIGYLPQDFGLPTGMSARQYLEYYALLYDVGSKRVREERVETLLDRVGLAERASGKIGTFSGGMRQRVAVARTLLRLPPVIIVDEPTVGLDPRERIRFRNLLARLSRGRIVLFSTHVVEDVAVACERVVVLAKGCLAFDGPPSELADFAEGRVWVVHVEPGETFDLPDGAKKVDTVPEAGGGMRLRILCDDSPHPRAEAIDPTLEDGYLALLHAYRHEEA